jgi:hypothetical protein
LVVIVTLMVAMGKLIKYVAMGAGAMVLVSLAIAALGWALSQFPFDVLKLFAETYVSVFSRVLDTVDGFINSVERIVVTIIQNIPPLIDSIGNSIRNVLEGIGSVILSVFNGISGVISAIGDNIIGVINSLGNNVNRVINSITDGISNILGRITDLRRANVDAVTDQIRTIANIPSENLIRAAEGVNALKNALEGFGQSGIFSAAGGRIANFISGDSNPFRQLSLIVQDFPITQVENVGRVLNGFVNSIINLREMLLNLTNLNTLTQPIENLSIIIANFNNNMLGATGGQIQQSIGAVMHTMRSQFINLQRELASNAQVSFIQIADEVLTNNVRKIEQEYAQLDNLLANGIPNISLSGVLNRFSEAITVARETITLEHRPININIDVKVVLDVDELAYELVSPTRALQLQPARTLG